MHLESYQILSREFKIALRTPAQFILPILFFILITTLFPLAITPDLSLLQKIAPGIIWIASLLATLLSLDRLFRDDFHDGTLEQILINPISLSYILWIKVIAHWCLTGLPLIIITPVLAMMFHLNWQTIEILILSLLLGTPILSFIGSIAVSLTVALRQGGVLLALLILPLFIPILIFGAGSVSAFMNGLAYQSELIFLAAMLIFAMSVTPFVCAGALRVGMMG